MGRYVENENDIRKTVKNSKGKKKINSKNNIKKFILLLLVICIVIAVVMVIKNRKVDIKAEQISEYNYFIVSESGKTGVIDKSGNIVLEPKYDYIQIPNPEKDLFICLYDYNSTAQEYSSKVMNSKGEEILTQYENVTAIPSNNTSVNWSYQTSLLKYKKNNKYGIISISGKKITEAIYNSIETLEYKDEILKVSEDGKYGLIKLNGDKILKIEYNAISADGYYTSDNKYENAGFIVSKKTDEGYRYGYIDYNGKQLLDCEFSSIKRINSIKNDSTAYLITYKNGQAGLNKNSQNVIANEYEALEYDDVNQIVSLEKNGKYGLYDLYGNMILPIQYDSLTFAGNIILASKDGKQLVFDPNGNIQKDFEYKSVMPTGDKKYLITIDLNGNYGIIDNNKNVLVENKYSYIEYAFDKYFIITENGKAGLIDSEDNKVLESKYNVVQNIIGTKIIQAITDNASEIYNSKLEYVYKITNAHIYIRENYIQIVNENDMVYLDLDGQKQEAKNVLTNNTIFAQKENDKWGFVDKNGNKVVDYIYDMVTDVNKYGFAGVKKDGKWGVIKSDGSLIQEPIYSLMEVSPSFIGKYYKSSADYEIEAYSND